MACAVLCAGPVWTIGWSGLAYAGPASSDWRTIGYDLANTRHVPFAQINSENVASLTPAWKYRTGVFGPFETTPLVVGRTMYITTGADNAVIALDAATGEKRWQYTPSIEASRILYKVNRGVAVDGGKVFLGTLDARLVALDQKTGSVRWQVHVEADRGNYSETMAPLAWNGMVFIGISGGDFGIRGSLSAYSQRDGRLLWRWWSVSRGWEGNYVASVAGMSLHRDIANERAQAFQHRNAWLKGGGPVWQTPALDPASSTIYAATGNPSPEFNGRSRPGDNLYTDCIVALNAKTGKLGWFYQQVPHDIWDYDAGSPPLLIDALDGSGRRVKAVAEAGKTGWVYILDRASGKEIRRSQPFVTQHNMFALPTTRGVLMAPAGGGGAVAPTAYDRRLHRIFIVGTQVAYIARTGDQAYEQAGQSYPVLAAIDVDSGKIVWRRAFEAGNRTIAYGGTLSAPGLLFASEETPGRFDAFDARNGDLLWQYQTDAGDAEAVDGHRSFREYMHDLLLPIKRWLRREQPSPETGSRIHAPPIAYMLDGREYIAVAADAFFRNGGSPGDSVYVFSLPSEGR